jgi:hypothetical protein
MNTNHINAYMQPVLTVTNIARETHSTISSRIDKAITALNEDMLPSKIVPSRSMGREFPLIGEEDGTGNLAHAHPKPLKGTLPNTNHITSGVPPVLAMPHIASDAHATKSSRIDKAITVLDEDILHSIRVFSQRTGKDVPLIEEEDDTGNPALNRVLSELKSFQKRDFECCENVDLAGTWNALGLIRLYMQRDAEEARKCHEEALRIYRNKCDEDRVAVAVILNDLGNCYEQLHQSSRALDSYNEAMRLLKEQKMSENHICMQATLRSISRLSRR